MEGRGYKIVDNKEENTEFLVIKKVNNHIVFEALAIKQNNGRIIIFTLNPEIKNKLSFENLEHDFPTKIQYTKVSDMEIFVEVLGENKKGFSAKMFKQ